MVRLNCATKSPTRKSSASRLPDRSLYSGSEIKRKYFSSIAAALKLTSNSVIVAATRASPRQAFFPHLANTQRVDQERPGEVVHVSVHARDPVDIHINNVHPPCGHIQLVMSQLVSCSEPLADGWSLGVDEDKSLLADEPIAPVDVAVVSHGVADDNSASFAQDSKRIDTTMLKP